MKGGVRSPLFVQWPAMIKSGIRVNNMASVTDILPSLTEILGVQSKIPFDGKSFWPYINNPDSINNDRVIVNHWKDKTSVRTQRFRLDHENRLYDITKDKEQLKDVSENYPQELIKLKEYKQKFLSDAVAPSIESAPIPMGYAYDWVQLPARDANFTGRIKRSNRWPNCSFLTDWKSSTDSIYWEVELVENAEYAVVLYYTADRNNVGTELILDYNGQSIKSPIKESFLSNFKNVEYDRAPRENSFMKDFKALNMGNIQLEKGKGNLVLTAPNVHPTGIDFRLLMLERIN